MVEGGLLWYIGRSKNIASEGLGEQNLSASVDGAKQRVSHAQTLERRPPLPLAKILTVIFSNLVQEFVLIDPLKPVQHSRNYYILIVYLF